MQWFYLDTDQQQVPADENELGTLLESGAIVADTMLWNETMADWQSARELFADWFPEAEAAPVAVPVTLRAPALVTRRSGATVGLVKRPLNTGGDGGSTTQKSSGPRTQRTSGTQTQRSAAGRTSKRAIEGKEEGEAADLVRELASTLGARAGWIKFVAVMAIIGGALFCLTLIGALVGWIPIWLGINLFKVATATEKAAYFGRKEDFEESLNRVGFFFKLNGIFIISYIAFVALVYGLIIAFGVAAMASMKPGAEAVPINSAPMELNSAPVEAPEDTPVPAPADAPGSPAPAPADASAPAEAPAAPAPAPAN